MGLQIRGVVATHWSSARNLAKTSAGVVAETFAGTLVEFGAMPSSGAGGIGAHVGAFGEVLKKQAVGVFVAAALPGRAEVGEVDLDAGGTTIQALLRRRNSRA